MLCPFNLCQVRQFTKNADSGFTCPECKESVPALYVNGYSEYPPSVLSSVGFRGHGKTVYLAALFHVLAHHELPRHWWGFYKAVVGQHSQEILDKNIGMLKAGKLPDSTAQNFPKPTLVQVTGIPTGKRATLLCYDAAGESFEKITRMVTYAKFLAGATTVLFLLSIPDLEREEYASVAQEMERLLTVYRNGIEELGGNTRPQRLVVVYTKADEWNALARPEYSKLLNYLKGGTFDGLDHYSSYKKSLLATSDQLKNLTAEHLRAQAFLNHAKDKFAGVEFCVISALGASPKGQNLQTGIAPRRVLDPLLWVLDKDLSRRNFVSHPAK
ncbi:MAG: TRAFAC clade GTPase domain-containing protein [Methylococcales bacterium]